MSTLNKQILVSFIKSFDNPSPTQSDFLIREGYLFRSVKLCILHTSLRDFLL